MKVSSFLKRAAVVAVGVAVVFAAGEARAAMTSASYRSEGLIAQWDAEDNAVDGNGVRYHDSAATVWKDLSGNGLDLAVKNGTWLDKALSLVNGNARRDGEMAAFGTMEVCFKVPTSGGNCMMFRTSQPRREVWLQTDKFILTYDRYGYASETSLYGLDTTFQFVYNGDQSMGYFNGNANFSYYNDVWGGSDEIIIGGRNGGTRTMTVYSVRIYSDILNENTLARHKLIDDLRFFGVTDFPSPAVGATSVDEAKDSYVVVTVQSAQWPMASDPESRKVFVDYRKTGASDWQSFEATGSFGSGPTNVLVRIDGLEGSTEYEVRARTTCRFFGENERSGTGETNTFTTLAPDPAPKFEVDAAAIVLGETDMEIPITVATFGYGAASLKSVTLSFGFAEGVYDYSESVDPSLVTVGCVILPMKRFGFATNYHARVSIVNANDQETAKTFAFETPEETYGGWMSPGLWQVKFVKNVNCTASSGNLSELTANPDCFDVMSQSVGEEHTQRQLVEGAIMAYAPAASGDASTVTSEFTGETYVLGNGPTYAYEGCMLFDATKRYVFGGEFYDATRVYVGDTQIFYQNGGNTLVTGEYLPEESGWKRLRVYVGHVSGGAGCWGGRQGIIWNDRGATSKTSGEWWQLIDKEAEFLGVFSATGATNSIVTIDRFYRLGNRLVAKVRLADGNFGRCRFYAYANISYGGATAIASPCTVELTSADGLSALCDMTVGADVNWIRFAAVPLSMDDAGVLWSPAVDWKSRPQSTDVPPMAISAVADTHNADYEALLSGSVFTVGENPTATVTVDGVEHAVVLDAQGRFSLGLTGLAYDTPHTASLSVSDSNGSDSLAFDDFVVQASVFGTSLTLTRPADAQRTIECTAGVTLLGVGETYAVLYAGNAAAAMVEVSRVKVERTGALTLTAADRAWGEKVYCKIVFETTCGSSVVTADTVTNSVVINDASHYKWKSSVPEGRWGDPANWTSDRADCIGIPSNSASYAEFPNAGSYRINVDGKYPAADIVFGPLTLTFCGDDPATSILDLSSNCHLTDGRVLVFDHVTVNSPHVINCTGASRIIVTNGANVSLRRGVAPTGAGSGLTVADGSRFSGGDLMTFKNGAHLVVDNSTLVLNNDMTFQSSTMTIAGTNPCVTASGAFVTATGVDPSTIVFVIPPTGYVAPPIVGSNAGKVLGSGGDLGWLRLSLTGEKAARHVRRQPLVVWAGGISTGNVVEGTIGLNGASFLYSETTEAPYRPWSKSPEGLTVKTVGMDGVPSGLVLIVK